MSITVTQEQLENLRIIEGDKSYILTAAIVKLFIYNQKDKKWLYTGLCGALCLSIDRSLNGSILFRLYDLNIFELLFEQELYYEFENLYRDLNESFFCFPVIGKFILSFSFADSNDALTMRQNINLYCPKKTKATQDSHTFPLKKGRKTNVFEKKEEIVMEKPTNFKHLNHIGWDETNKCCDFSQLSKEFKTVFKNAGIKKKEMRNAETALAIYETLLNQGNISPLKNNKNLQQNQKSKETSKTDRKKSMSASVIARKSTKSKTNTLDVQFNQKNIEDPGQKEIKIENSEIKNNDQPDLSNIPLPPKLNLNLMGPPPPIEISKISSQNVLGIDDLKSPKKTINKQKNHIVNEGGERKYLLDQIKAGNFKLKKVEPLKPDTNKQLSKQEEMSLTMVLAKAIAERRKNMVKDESESEPESDWSD